MITVLTVILHGLLTSDCWLLEFKKLISHEPDDETRFPDSSVAKKDQFKVTNTVAHFVDIDKNKIVTNVASSFVVYCWLTIDY